MIKELDSIDSFEEFIADLNSDPHFSSPMLATPEDIKDNLYNALNKPNDHVFGVFQDEKLIGLFVFLIIQEEKYMEMIIGLSRYSQAYEDILAYLENHYAGYQADFVFNPENRILKELLVQKGASFDTEQQKMILNDRGTVIDTEGIKTLSERYRDKYIAIHDNDRYWTGEKTADATGRFNVYVATENDDVIGYLDITNCFDENEIFDLLVLEPYRRRGWGRKLLAEAIKENRPKKMFLTVDVDNLPAIHLYESLGFAIVNGQNSQTVNWNIPELENNMTEENKSRIAHRGDWKTEPMPEQHESFVLHRSFSDEEMNALRHGNIPQAMEDKWFWYMEGSTLWAHRSWTGHCIYRIEFKEDNNHVVTVNRDPEQYTCTSIEEDIESLNKLLDWWIQTPYDHYNEWLSETYDTLKKAGKV